MSEVDRGVASLQGLPRKNGELVFEAPWQSRAFGMAVALSEGGAYSWEDFRRNLIAEVAEDPEREYYATWLEAFEQLLLDRRLLTLDRRLLTPDEFERRTDEYRTQARDDVF